MVTVVVDEVLWPLSSDTLQVIVVGPVGAPVEEKLAVLPVPFTPAGRGRVAVGQRGRYCGLIPGGRDGAAVTRLQGGGAGRAADRRRFKFLYRKGLPPLPRAVAS